MIRFRQVPVNEQGDVELWKALVGATRSRKMARPGFPRHQPNYNLDRGVLIRIKAMRRITGAIPLESEFAKRE